MRHKTWLWPDTQLIFFRSLRVVTVHQDVWNRFWLSNIYLPLTSGLKNVPLVSLHVAWPRKASDTDLAVMLMFPTSHGLDTRVEVLRIEIMVGTCRPEFAGSTEPIESTFWKFIHRVPHRRQLPVADCFSTIKKITRSESVPHVYWIYTTSASWSCPIPTQSQVRVKFCSVTGSKAQAWDKYQVTYLWSWTVTRLIQFVLIDNNTAARRHPYSEHALRGARI